MSGTVFGGPRFVDLTPGYVFTIALDRDGKAYAWGSGADGHLGTGTEDDAYPEPARVIMPDGVNFTQISAGYEHTLAVGSDGNAYAWGYNALGQLGDGTTTTRLVPTRVDAPPGVAFTTVAGGSRFSFALDADGNAYAWGYNGNGNLGDGTTDDQLTPVRVSMPPGVTFTRIAPGGENFALAVGSDGKIYSWGNNSSGELGDGTQTDRLTPAQVALPDGPTFTDVAGGSSHAVALDSEGRVYTWGSNFQGELGTGDLTAPRLIPEQTSLPTNARAIQVSAGNYYSMALSADGTSYGWGANTTGLIGDGTREDRLAPVATVMPAATTFTKLLAGYDHTLALSSDGDLFQWGFILSDRPDPAVEIPEGVERNVTVTRVLFGAVEGTNLDQDGSSWSAMSPPGCGPVDIAVDYIVWGESFTEVFPSAFSQGTAPVITEQPAPATIEPGGEATVDSRATGDSAPTVAWETSPSETGPWTAVVSATNPELTLKPNENTWVRAVFTNCLATVASAPAYITIASQPTPSPTTPPSSDPAANGGKLPSTGVGSGIWSALAIAVALIGAGTLFFIRRNTQTSTKNG